METPTRMRQVYDGGPPGKFRFSIKPWTVVFVAVIAFFVVHRFGVFAVGDDAGLQSRLDVAAEQLAAHYDRHPPKLGRVTRVYADSTRVHVDLLMSAEEYQALLAAPEHLRTASLQAACPRGGDVVYDMISINQSIALHGRSAGGLGDLDIACARYRL